MKSKPALLTQACLFLSSRTAFLSSYTGFGNGVSLCDWARCGSATGPLLRRYGRCDGKRCPMI